MNGNGYCLESGLGTRTQSDSGILTITYNIILTSPVIQRPAVSVYDKKVFRQGC